MKQFFASLLLLSLFSLPLLSQQKIVSLHPLLGDTISNQEKRLFLLFPEIPDSTFDYALLTEAENNHLLNSHLYSKKQVNLTLDSVQMDEYRTNIDKLLAYYSKLDEINTSSVMTNNSSGTHSVSEAYMAMTPAMKKELKKNATRYHWLKMEAQERGLFGRELDHYVQTKGLWTTEGSSKKKKKKKKKKYEN